MVTQVPRFPVRQILLWYAVVGSLGTVLASRIALVHDAVFSGPLSDGGGVGGGPGGMLPDFSIASSAVTGDLLMIVIMVGTVLLTIPVSWGYMAIRQHEGFDQSVVQTIVVLPVVVAAIMMIVQHSLALAFALAGVSAAVRFRNTLKDVSDATYVFLALGIGIAAGVGSLAAAAIMSSGFILVSVTLWYCDYGSCPSTVAFAAAGNVHPLDGSERNGTSPPRREGLLSIQVNDAMAGREDLEAVLDGKTKKWKLERTEPEPEGGALLRYRVRLKKSADPDAVVREIATWGGEAVVAAAFDVPLRPVSSG
jgi:hypothetical protein